MRQTHHKFDCKVPTESAKRGFVPFRFWHSMLHVLFLVTWRRGATYFTLFMISLFSSSLLLSQNLSAQQPDNKETYVDWVVECYEKTVAKANCQLYQRILFDSGKSVALVMTMTPPLEDQDSRVQIALPLGIQLSKGANIKVDGNYNLGLEIDHCTNRGCIINNNTPNGLIKNMHTGKQATVSVIAENGAAFNIPLSLRGFKEAYSRVIDISTK